MNTCIVRRTSLFGAILLAAGFIANAQSASAQCGYGGGFGAYGAWDVGRLYSVLADRVPYYAAFPPVYYSIPVARTYGYSPFAYPPGTMTPEVEVAEPLAIENPYFKGSSTASSGKSGSAVKAEAAPVDRTTSAAPQPAPLTVINPFVKPSIQTASLTK